MENSNNDENVSAETTGTAGTTAATPPRLHLSKDQREVLEKLMLNQNVRYTAPFKKTHEEYANLWGYKAPQIAVREC